jgi:hypothetical protein
MKQFIKENYCLKFLKQNILKNNQTLTRDCINYLKKKYMNVKNLIFKYKINKQKMGV